MTAIVALKDKNRFILASDSQVSASITKDFVVSQGSRKLSVSQDGKGAIAMCGDCSIFNVQYTEKLFSDFNEKFKKFDYGYVVNVMIPKLFITLMDLHILGKPNPNMSVEGAFLVASKGKCFFIDGDRSVVEVSDYYASGSGCELVSAVLDRTTKIDDPIKRIKLAMKAATKNTLFVSGDVFYCSTEDLEIHRIPAKEIMETEE